MNIDLLNTSKLNVDQEVKNITEEIAKSLGQNSYDFEDLKERIDTVINVLNEAKIEYRAKQQLIHLKKNNVDSASDMWKNAEQALADARQNLIDKEYTRNRIASALRQGYIIIVQLREQITGEKIRYEVIATGNVNGNPVLLRGDPSLADILRASNLDTRNFALRVTMTEKQFNTVLKSLEAKGTAKDLKNSVLNKMAKIQLSAEQQVMWSRLSESKQQLEEKVHLNYGQISEAFVEYLNTDNFNIDNIDQVYSLLEKSTNVLKYYKGPDVVGKSENGSQDLMQVKALSLLGKSNESQSAIGRFDVATLTNVLNPLTEIRKMIDTVESTYPQDLENYFKASEKEGERKFKPELEQTIKSTLQNTIEKIPMPFSSS